MAYDGRKIYPILGMLIPPLVTEGYVLTRFATNYREPSSLETALIVGGTLLAMVGGTILGMYLDNLTKKRNNSHRTI